MSSVNTNLISEARYLSMGILSGSLDPIEAKSFRTCNRVIGALIDYFVSSIPMSIFFIDSSTDRKKLKQIDAKLMDLDTVELEETNPNYEKAAIARDFQKEVYTNIRSYTSTANKIKIFTWVSFGVLSIGLDYLARHSSFSPDRILNQVTAFNLAIHAGVLLTLPAAVHWLAAGGKLDGVNQVLAKQALNRLPD